MLFTPPCPKQDMAGGVRIYQEAGPLLTRGARHPLRFPFFAFDSFNTFFLLPPFLDLDPVPGTWISSVDLDGVCGTARGFALYDQGLGRSDSGSSRTSSSGKSYIHPPHG